MNFYKNSSKKYPHSMTKKFYIYIFFIFIFFYHGFAEADHKIIAVQSVRIKPYEKTIEGFKSVTGSDVKRIVISELNDTNIIKTINSFRPDIVLAIGMGALQVVKEIKDIPVVYMMVFNPASIIFGKKNIFGVSMSIPPEKQLNLFLKVLPHVKNIGLLYDPDRTGYIVKDAMIAAGKMNINLIAKEIQNSRDVPSELLGMRKKIDVFWMLPDLTLITPATIKFLLLFSLENKIPVLAFSDKYVELGALMSINIDAFDIGSQAGEIVNAIVSGSDLKNIKKVDARKSLISINANIARKLEININNNIIKEARIIK
ncbi:MAG: ABC transporter substrate-binding protein [Desulfobacteraceae bacterium]|nr:ABC transporter substrate-binding protein [Desulfobacteraceae bacterium]MBC2720278.1 ABC transporter substrate-binding protein [Desulfobacteraceae bacterium]